MPVFRISHESHEIETCAIRGLSIDTISTIASRFTFRPPSLRLHWYYIAADNFKRPSL
jgi:hypothetical protein